MLLFDDSKKLEKALGEDAASIIAHVFEKADENFRRDLATKADLQVAKAELQTTIAQVKAELRSEMHSMKTEIIKWMVGGFIAQTALIVAILAFLRP